jgi:hypothetical protein
VGIVPDASTVTVVERDEVAVMFTSAADEQKAISRAWSDLETAVGSLRGRRFFGVFDEVRHEYRACVEMQPGDDPDALGLELGTLAGGRYARRRLRGEPPGIYAQIAPAFQELAQRPDRDDTRQGIEHYRSHDVIDLLLPLA